jgi:excisionase family DNA binding protein
MSIDLISPRDAANVLKVTEGTLAVWRCNRRYDLPFVRVGRSVKYQRADIERFVEQRTVGSNSETR